MVSRHELQLKIQDLETQIVKEWMKQAYFRTENNHNVNLFIQEISKIEEQLTEHAETQETLVKEALILTGDEGQSTPRFLSPRGGLENIEDLDIEEMDESWRICFNLIFSMKNALDSVFDRENFMIAQYRGFIEKNQKFEYGMGKSKENSKYEEECEKVNRLTRRLKMMDQDFKKLQEELEGLRGERKNLQEKITTKVIDEGCENCEILNDKIQKQSRKIKILGDEREAIISEIAEFKELQEELEKTNEDLLKRLDAEESKSFKLEEELSARLYALDKAETIIKKLNDECERLAKELGKVEQETTNLKKESRYGEKDYIDCRKKINDFEISKKTEERLREEVNSLKLKLSDLNDSKNLQINDLNQSIQQLITEKTNLEGALEELEEKFIEIEKMSQERMGMFYQSCNKAQELEEALARKENEIKLVVEENKAKETARDQEVEHWRRQAENVIRHLHNLQTSEIANKVTNNRPPLREMQIKNSVKKTTRCKSPVKDSLKGSENCQNPETTLSSSNANLLSQQIEEAQLREARLQKQLNKIIADEANIIERGIALLGVNTGTCRSELERWIMRNEEMEQKLVEMGNANVCFKKMIGDLKKTIIIKSQQMEEQKEQYELLKKEMQGFIDYLISELSEARSYTLNEALPRSQQVISSTLSSAHQKIAELTERVNLARIQAEENEISLENEKNQHLMTYKELDTIKRDYVRLKNDLWHIRKQLNLETPVRVHQRNASFSNAEDFDPSDSIFATKSLNVSGEMTQREISDLEEISDPTKIILQTIKNMQNYNEEIRAEINKIKTDNTILRNEYEKSEKECGYLKDIAAKEKDEKIRIKTQVTEEISILKLKLDEAGSYAQEVMKEKNILEDQFIRTRKESEGAQCALEKALVDLKVKDEELRRCREDLDLTYGDLRASKDYKSQIINLQEIIDSQDLTLKSLKNEVSQLEFFKSSMELSRSRRDAPEKEIPYSNRHKIEEMQDELTYIRKENIELRQTLERITNEQDRTQRNLHQRSRSETERSGHEESIMRSSITSKEAYTDHLEKLLSQKNEIISQLEIKIKSTAQGQEFEMIRKMEGEINKLKKKIENNKRSFQNRVKEFELLLRFIEEKINISFESEGYTAIPKSDKMYILVRELSEKNPTLAEWLEGISKKLENCGNYLKRVKENAYYK
ncbi:unnamed protein product [Blepharisma stoltei]|uniref:Uncharacterized protein n=1 Tax=Blepharisma stoltei TaxID=1481888 RepID=A0AAU9IUU1_9CILI|nr:unnamed protein product [Blepharisma stoltei]